IACGATGQTRLSGPAIATGIRAGGDHGNEEHLDRAITQATHGDNIDVRPPLGNAGKRCETIIMRESTQEPTEERVTESKGDQ
ncbi:MAG TPA: hypothetical protein VGC53_16175, partial [Vicinamibacteria bacterium]